MATPAPARLYESAAWAGELATAPMAAVFCGTGGAASAQVRAAHTIICEDNVVRAVAAGHRQALALRGPVIVAFLDARRFSWSSTCELVERWRQRAPRADARALVNELLQLPQAVVDVRVLRAIERFAAGQPLAEVARDLGLSVSRLTHVVTEAVGAPPRAWRSWLRLRDGLDLLLEGASATHAAHGIGYFDSPHFTHACRAALGLAPSSLRGLMHRRDGPRCERR